MLEEDLDRLRQIGGGFGSSVTSRSRIWIIYYKLEEDWIVYYKSEED
jgi:hypothetical protein